jgi:hypothetical protein
MTTPGADESAPGGDGVDDMKQATKPFPAMRLQTARRPRNRSGARHANRLRYLALGVSRSDRETPPRDESRGSHRPLGGREGENC